MSTKQKRAKPRIGRKLSIVFICLAGISLLAGAANYAYYRALRQAPKLPKPSLRELASARRVKLGVLTYPRHLSDPVFQEILTSQYSEIVSDAEIHWDKLRPSRDRYDFSQIDTLVAYAQQHNMSVQAHHLVWNENDSLPKWLKNGHYGQQELLQIMQDHITTVVGRYKGRVTEWSVVNEHFTRTAHTYGLDNWWAEQFGNTTDYIDKAFIAARQADPQAVLLLNDFNNETENDISNAQLAYMKLARTRGVPIDGVGMQMHLDATQPPNRLAMVRNMQRFKASGFKVYITEFDISSSNVSGSLADKQQLEAQITSDVVRACVDSQACSGLVNFGMTDITKFQSFTHARQRSNLFTKRFQPKPAFYAFRAAWQD